MGLQKPVDDVFLLLSVVPVTLEIGAGRDAVLVVVVVNWSLPALTGTKLFCSTFTNRTFLFLSLFRHTPQQWYYTLRQQFYWTTVYIHCCRLQLQCEFGL